jgi:hypothetical protein
LLLIAPTSANRREFARWAISKRVSTRSSNTFAVPDKLFETIPEQVLVGATVNGQPYVSNGTAHAEPDGPTAPQPVVPEPAPEPVSKQKNPAPAAKPVSEPAPNATTIVPF